jgi:hypothetical protein
MIAMSANPKGTLDHFSHPARGPHLSSRIHTHLRLWLTAQESALSVPPLTAYVLLWADAPSRPRLIQGLTAPSLTPNALAMSFCCQPSSFSFHARFRRSSRQSAARRCSHTTYCLILDFFLSRSVTKPLLLEAFSTSATRSPLLSCYLVLHYSTRNLTHGSLSRSHFPRKPHRTGLFFLEIIYRRAPTRRVSCFVRQAMMDCLTRKAASLLAQERMQ